MNIDTLSPSYIGEDRIKLSVSPTTSPPRVGRVVEVLTDFSACLPEGCSLPLDVIVQGPGANSYKEKVIRSRLPEQLSFVPIEAGVHLMIVREQAHNRWIGRLRVAVEGDLVEA